MSREVTMIEFKEVLRLWQEQVPKKRIAAQLGLDPKMVLLLTCMLAGRAAEIHAARDHKLERARRKRQPLWHQQGQRAQRASGRQRATLLAYSSNAATIDRLGLPQTSRTKSNMSEHYHRAELKIALDPSHPAHSLPPPLPLSERVLDIGCGAGQTLKAAYSDRISYGLDIDLDALKLGRSLTDHVCFVCAKAEALPFPNGQFDMVIARVSLPYTNISTSLKEIHRILTKGGELWMTLHPFSIEWRQAKSSNYKGWIFFAYIVLNSVLFHFTQKQFPFLGRYESFQTERGISQALMKNGFQNISVGKGKHFLVTAHS